MKQLDSIHHLVHIGFDPEEQNDFSKAVKLMIEGISDNSGAILNFVDESLYSPEEAEKVQVIMLANTLASFVSYYHAHSLMPSLFNDTGTINTLKINEPKEALDFLYEALEGTWQKLKEPVVSFENFTKRNSFFSGVEPGPEILEEINKQDSIFTGLMKDKLLDILLQMIDHFYGKNIYDIKISESVENDEVENKYRKQEIMEYAERLLGKERIIISGMRDGEINQIISANEFKNGVEPFTLSQGITLEAWEKTFGNATEYIDDINADISIMRGKRFKKAFFDAIIGKGFELTNNTSHILGGEYYGRCVNGFNHMLKIFGINEANIFIDKDISLIKLEDMGKFSI